MKKILLFSLLLCAFACTKEEAKEEKPAAQQGPQVSISASASVGDLEVGFDRIWSKTDDRMGVFAEGRVKIYGENVKYTPLSGSITADFTSESPLIWKGEAMDLYAYLPYSSLVSDCREVPVNIPAEQTVIEGQADMTAVVMCGSARVEVENDQADFKLRPFASLLKLDVTSLAKVGLKSIKVSGASGDVLAFDGGTLDLTDGSLEVGGTESSAVSIKIAEPVEISATPKTFYAWVNPCVPTGGKVTVTAVIDDKEIDLGEYALPKTGFEAGYITELSLKSTYVPDTSNDTGADIPLDQAIDLSASGASNTYIVTQACKLYCFNAKVKGNGQARSFTWTVDGKTVTKGYSDVDINPASAELLWYASPKSESGYVLNSPVLIKTVKYNASDGKIYFQTPEVFVNGNVVIAARDASGNILWSWTIWATEGYDADQNARKVGRFTVMDRNLGAFAGTEAANYSDALKAALAVGNYYQWGRKDPFPATVDYNSFTSMPWGLPAFTPVASLQQSAHGYNNVIYTSDPSQNSVMLGTTLGASFDVDKGVAESVKYPYKWMFNGTSGGAAPYIWAVGNHSSQSTEQQTEWRYLWGCVDGNTSSKTIYDPCPPGWKIPTADMWLEAMENVTLSTGTHGAVSTLYDMYIPFAGQKKAGNSKYGGVNAAYLASATVTSPWYPTKGDIVYYLSKCVPTGYGTKNPAQYDSYAGQGLQVRCVKEEVASSTAALGTGTKTYDAILMGDSITEQWPLRGRKAFFTDNNYLCKGVSGHTTMDMVARFTNDVLNNKPKVVVITAGTNDLAANDGFHMSSEDILNNVRLMAQVAEDYGAKVIIGAVCPSIYFYWKNTDNPLYKGQGVANRIIEHNKKLKAWAESKGYRYADYHTPLKDSENGLKSEYCWSATDFVHPNAAGYTVMEGVLKPLIDAALKE